MSSVRGNTSFMYYTRLALLVRHKRGAEYISFVSLLLRWNVQPHEGFNGKALDIFMLSQVTWAA